MRLSVLRWWRSATDNDLIIRPSLVLSAPARLSCRYHTHATWHRDLSPAPVSCTFGSPASSYQSSEYPSRRYHSHQKAAEKAAPQAVSLATVETATGFQARRIRARRIAEAEASEAASRRDTESRHGKPNPGKAKGRKNTKLKKATRAAQKASLRMETEPAEIQKEGNLDFGIDNSAGKDAGFYFGDWGPAVVADAVHFEALERARSAALRAKRLARRAENATAKALGAQGSCDEDYAIRKRDAIRARAELAASFAKQMAQYAAEKERAYDTIKSEIRAGFEKQPIYWEREHSEVAVNHRLRAVVRNSCAACSAPHPLTQCPVLFKDLAVKDSDTLLPVRRRIFQDRLELDDRFREAMSFILSKFTVSTGPTREVIPLDRRATDDAPASAISKSPHAHNWLYQSEPDLRVKCGISLHVGQEYLQSFDTRIFFRQILGKRRKFSIQYAGLPFNLHWGYCTYQPYPVQYD